MRFFKIKLATFSPLFQELLKKNNIFHFLFKVGVEKTKIFYSKQIYSLFITSPD